MLKYRKKEILAIALILGFALFTTNKIYYKFINQRSVDYESDTIDVTFREKSGDKVNITKVTPVSDNVGLSSEAYKFSVTNNSQNKSKFSVNIVDNAPLISVDNCTTYQIPHNVIKVSIHKGKEENKIYYLSDLVGGNIEEGFLRPNEKVEYTIRFWIDNSATGVARYFHYHGLIQVEESSNEIASIVNID